MSSTQTGIVPVDIATLERKVQMARSGKDYRDGTKARHKQRIDKWSKPTTSGPRPIVFQNPRPENPRHNRPAAA
jgi:hypothetical protein